MSEPRLCRVAGRDAWHVYDQRRRISTGETERAAALRFLADYKTGLAEPSRPVAVTVGDLLVRYLANRRAKGKPGAERVSWAHKPLARHIGGQLAERVDAAGYRSARAAEGVSPSTIRTELQALRAALTWAKIPDVEIDLPQRPQSRQRWLTREEGAALLAACADRHLRLFVLLGLNTAARHQAILGLTWDRVDLDQRILDYRDPGREATKKRRARVRINDTLHAGLVEAKERAASSFVIEWAGGPVASVRHGFASACAAAGLDDVTPHVMRHSAVTWMLQARVPRWEICGMAGMTLDVLERDYGHHDPDFMAHAAAALQQGPEVRLNTRETETRGIERR